MRPSEKPPPVRAAARSVCDRFGCGDLGRLVFRQQMPSVVRGTSEDRGRPHPGRGVLGENRDPARPKGGRRAHRVR